MCIYSIHSESKHYVVSLLLFMLLFIKHFSTSEHDFSFMSSGFYRHSFTMFLHVYDATHCLKEKIIK